MARYLITGGSSGIGAALAERLGAQGHELILAGRTGDLRLDLADPASLASADLPDRLDGLVHSAGTVALGTVAELTVEQWQRQLTVNLVGAAELTRLLLPVLRAARGRVVFVNSGSGLRTNPGWAGYAASKHGLRALADALRAEEPALSVTSIFPGRTATPMQRSVREHEGGEYEPAAYLDPATVAKVIADVLATPEDGVVTELSLRPA